MPKIVTRDDGTVLADELTVAEIDRLRELGIEFDVGEGDGGGGGGGSEPDPDEVPEEISEATDPASGTPGDDEPEDEEPADDQPAPSQPDDADPDPDEEPADDPGDADDDFEDWDDLEDVDEDDAAGRADERRYEKVQRTEDHKTTSLGQRQTQRDNDLDDPTLDMSDESHDRIEDILNDTGLADEIRRAFEQFKTRDITVASERGKSLNVSNIVRHMSGDYGERRVYSQRYTAATGGRTIGVCLDISGSMDTGGYHGEGAIVDAKVGLGALHVATEAMNDRMLATGFATDAHGDHSNVLLPLIVGPGEKWRWEYLDTVTPEYMTPTAHAVDDMRDLLLDAGGKELVMVVVTDGEPTYTLDGKSAAYSGNAGRKETVGDAAQKVQEARHHGIKVIGMGVGRGVKTGMMDDVFGPGGWVRTDEENLAQELVGVYREQLDITPGPAGY